METFDDKSEGKTSILKTMFTKILAISFGEKIRNFY